MGMSFCTASLLRCGSALFVKGFVGAAFLQWAMSPQKSGVVPVLP